MKKCPKCGYKRQQGNTECPKCGIIYEKYESSLAKKQAEEEARKQEKVATGWVQKAQILYDLGKHQEAIDAYTNAINLNPKYAQAYYGRGIVYHRLGNYKEATRDLEASAWLGHKRGKEFVKLRVKISQEEKGGTERVFSKPPMEPEHPPVAQSRSTGTRYVPGVKCPTCGSARVTRIGKMNKVGSAAIFGVFAIGHISKTFKCENCRYKW
jgi:ssDNA-binding Zn-finger/Zn-ribbon topoisomerase 1